jgi:hypothetical protein
VDHNVHEACKEKWKAAAMGGNQCVLKELNQQLAQASNVTRDGALLAPGYYLNSRARVPV